MKSNPPPPTVSLGFGIIRKAKEYRRGDDEPSAVRKAKILVVDDDPALRRLMETRLGAANYAVETAGDAQAAMDACLLSRPNLVITDLRMKDADGLAFLKELKSRWPLLTVIILTAHGTIAEAVEATQCGAFGYLVKPVDKEELLGQVERATATSSFALGDDWRANIVSRSQLMEERLGIANRAATSDVPVLLTGENGTGKELLARAIHAASARREKPFVAVSCRGRMQHELASELFGDASDESALERVRGGALFLDEIGELPMEIQVGLSKALAKEHLPSGKWLGAVRTDVRLISTTSHDLKSLTESGAFLRDLYYQINILPIEMPPLGRRREDIPLLVSHFLEQATDSDGQGKIYSPKAIELLATTDWPGNVRQLFDLVKRNVALSHGEVMSKDFVQQSLGGDSAKIPTYNEARDQFSRDYLAENLQRTAGNVTKAARLAKRSRTDFYKLLARYRLHADDFKTAESTNNKKSTDGDEEA
ncbi:MAG TPA: sigma 54-interacting transcriptional regulator [Steroidobacteraceae bacterium]|jgi:two-component system response regulator GlrR|nr:sigma 54-interacting transcriptional regulator [Steroidobacteraceae bacterium]